MLNIECEDRVMLTEEEYFEVLAFYLRNKSEIDFIMQTNIYIDSVDFILRKSGKSLRIRTINGKYSELTLKIKGKEGDKEYNEILPLSKLNDFTINGIFPDGEIKNILILDGININFLQVLTSLDTRRYEEKIEDYLLVIDKNDYNGITDYNLEVEAPSKSRAHEVMISICEKFKISYSSEYITKSSRALSSIK